jgi:hypothetical protein
VETLTPGEVHVLTGIAAPGLCITVRNDAGGTRRFRAQIHVVRDLAAMRDEIVHVVERDWAAVPEAPLPPAGLCMPFL